MRGGVIDSLFYFTMNREIKIQAYLPGINLTIEHVVVYREGMIGFHQDLIEEQLGDPEDGYVLDYDGLYLWDDEGNKVKIYELITYEEWILIEADGDFVLSQFTGAKDKKETAVWEGSIVKYWLIDKGEALTGWIVYNEFIGSFQIMYKNIYDQDVTDHIHKYNIEVIGDIHRNPALLPG